jgi:hypothetical protein
MLYHRRLLFTLSLLVTIFWGSLASAAYEYRYVFGSTNYFALPGQIVPVEVYLQETVSGGSTPWFTTPGLGLFSGGVRVTFDGAPLPSDRAEVLSTANITKNPLFTDPSATLSVVTGSSAGLIAAVNDPFTQLISGTVVNPSTSRILLGTFNFTAGLIPNEVTNLLASDYDLVMPTNQNVVFNSQTFASADLDALIIPANATITVIPEPSSLALLGLGGAALVGWQVRRLRRQQK